MIMIIIIIDSYFVLAPVTNGLGTFYGVIKTSSECHTSGRHVGGIQCCSNATS